MPKVSIIIPVYNVEDYLRECLDSVVNQTLKDIEIILVDDGSTDSSLSICQEYAQKDDRIIVLTQKNQGAGVARNNGIKIATGAYLSIIDSDDFFDLSMLEKLYNKAVKYDLDITICRSQALDEIDKKISDITYSVKKNYLPNKEIFNYKDFPKYIFNFCVGWSWDKLYNRNFVVYNNIRFPNLHNSEDMLFVFLSLVLAEKIFVLDEILVTHRQNRLNQLSQSREKAPFCFIDGVYSLKKELENKNIYENVEQSFINFVVEFSAWQTGTIQKSKAKKIIKKLKKETFKDLKIFDKPKEFFYQQSSIDFLIKLAPKKYFYKNFGELIFSIKNYKNYKIMTFLGLKLKVKRKRSK